MLNYVKFKIFFFFEKFNGFRFFQVLKDAEDCISSIQVNGHEILVSSLDCWVRLYDIRMGKYFADFIGGEDDFKYF